MLKQSVRIGSHGSLHYVNEDSVFPVNCEVVNITDTVIVLRVDDVNRLEIASTSGSAVNFKGIDIAQRDFMCPFIQPMYSKKDPSLVAVNGNIPCVYRDRRMYPRYVYDVQIGIRITASDEFFMVECRDISEGGISFYCDAYIPQMSHISLDIFNRYNKTRQQFDVIRVTEVNSSDKKWYGCQFSQKDPWIHELVENIVDDLYLQEVL